MKTQMTLIRIILLSVAIFSCLYAGSIYEDAHRNEMYLRSMGGNSAYEPRPDSAADGAVAGFAVMSGLSLIALAITYLKKEE